MNHKKCNFSFAREESHNCEVKNKFHKEAKKKPSRSLSLHMRNRSAYKAKKGVIYYHLNQCKAVKWSKTPTAKKSLRREEAVPSSEILYTSADRCFFIHWLKFQIYNIYIGYKDVCTYDLQHSDFRLVWTVCGQTNARKEQKQKNWFTPRNETT